MHTKFAYHIVTLSIITTNDPALSSLLSIDSIAIKHIMSQVSELHRLAALLTYHLSSHYFLLISGCGMCMKCMIDMRLCLTILCASMRKSKWSVLPN